jgi:hypothetical protein
MVVWTRKTRNLHLNVGGRSDFVDDKSMLLQGNQISISYNTIILFLIGQFDNIATAKKNRNDV